MIGITSFQRLESMDPILKPGRPLLYNSDKSVWYFYPAASSENSMNLENTGLISRIKL